MKIQEIFVMTALVLVSGCAPQAELVKTRSEVTDVRAELKSSRAQIQELQKQQREFQKRMDGMESNAKGASELQKAIADFGARTDQLGMDIQLLQGRLEENNFRIADLGQKLDDKSFQIAELTARVDELDAKVKALSSGQTSLTAPTGTAESKAGQKSMEPSEAYRQAMNDYNSGNFDLALAGFQNYLSRFPNATQADKAQYWVGECYYAKKDYKAAIDAFSKLLKNHAKSEKVPGAKLKIGYAYLSDNNKAKAGEWLNRVIKDYPGTKEAELARNKLKQIGK